MARAKKPLGVTHVSAPLHTAVKELESSAMAVEKATYYSERDAAYAHLTAVRASLYAYVADLERRLDIPQTVKLRF